MEMIEIKIPKVMRQFGYNLNLSATQRRMSLLKMIKYAGKDSVLFNMSSAMFMTKKNNQIEDYGKLRSDMRFIIKKIKII